MIRGSESICCPQLLYEKLLPCRRLKAAGLTLIKLVLRQRDLTHQHPPCLPSLTHLKTTPGRCTATTHTSTHTAWAVFMSQHQDSVCIIASFSKGMFPVSSWRRCCHQLWCENSRIIPETDGWVQIKSSTIMTLLNHLTLTAVCSYYIQKTCFFIGWAVFFMHDCDWLSCFRTMKPVIWLAASVFIQQDTCSRFTLAAALSYVAQHGRWRHRWRRLHSLTADLPLCTGLNKLISMHEVVCELQPVLI